MKIRDLMDYIQESLNDGRLMLDSEVCIRNEWGDIHSVEDMRSYRKELVLAEQEPT